MAAMSIASANVHQLASRPAARVSRPVRVAVAPSASASLAAQPLAGMGGASLGRQLRNGHGAGRVMLSARRAPASRASAFKVSAMAEEAAKENENDKKADSKGEGIRQLLGVRGGSRTDDIWKIRLQLTKPVTWVPLIWGVLCGAAASGHFTWTPENVGKSMLCMFMSGPLLTGRATSSREEQHAQSAAPMPHIIFFFTTLDQKTTHKKRII